MKVKTLEIHGEHYICVEDVARSLVDDADPLIDECGALMVVGKTQGDDWREIVRVMVGHVITKSAGIKFPHSP
jgi:hypothetical protein